MAATAARVRDCCPVTIVIIPQNLAENQMKLTKRRLGHPSNFNFHQ
jgi:hypothetical protein